MTRKFTRIFVCVLLVAVLAVGQMMTASAESNDKLTFAIIYANIHPFFDAIGQGAEDTIAKEGYNAEMILQGPQNGDVSQQIQIMEDLITQKVDGIAIGPCDSEALTPYIDEAVDAGIPVLCFDTDAPNSKRVGYVGTDNYEAGRALGEELGKALNGKGTVLCETGVVAQAGLIARRKGIDDVLAAEYPGVTIVQSNASNGDVTKALSDIENMITSYPDFDALIQLDAAGEAGISAFKSRGWTKADKLLIVFDDLTAVIQGVKDGQVYCTVTQGQYNWGSTIVKELMALHNGETISANVNTGYVVINADNVMEKYPD
jgi:ribose transport system substrate-binding protein